MVDPQKRQIRSCLEAASLSSFRGSFEAEEGDDTNLPPHPGSASASPTTSFGKVASSGEISDTEVRRQPRLSHESSMNVGDLPPPRPRRYAREDVLDSGWGPARLTAVSSVLAIALGRDATSGPRRDPSTKHLRYSRESGYTSDTSQHGGTSFGRLTILSSPSPSRANAPSPSAVGGLAIERALASPSPLGGGSNWMSPSRWGRKEKEGCFKHDASRDRRAPLDMCHDTQPHGARPPPLVSPTSGWHRASSAAPGLGRASTASFRLPCDAASFNLTSDPDPSPPCHASDSPPRQRLICNVPSPPPTPSQTWRFRHAFSLVSRGPLARRLKAVAEKQKAGCRSPWRQVHPQPAAAATGYTTDTRSASDSDSYSSEISIPSLGDSSFSPASLRNDTLAPDGLTDELTDSDVSTILSELLLPAAFEGKAATRDTSEMSLPKLSPISQPISQPRAARKLVFTDSTNAP